MGLLSSRTDNELLVAKRSAAVFIDGRRHRIRKDITLVREGHPLLDSHGYLFGPLTVHYDTADRAPEVQAARPTSPRRRRTASDGPGDAPTGDQPTDTTTQENAAPGAQGATDDAASDGAALS
jgi:hypothetical protein